MWIIVTLVIVAAVIFIVLKKHPSLVEKVKEAGRKFDDDVHEQYEAIKHPVVKPDNAIPAPPSTTRFSNPTDLLFGQTPEQIAERDARNAQNRADADKMSGGRVLWPPGFDLEIPRKNPIGTDYQRYTFTIKERNKNGNPVMASIIPGPGEAGGEWAINIVRDGAQVFSTVIASHDWTSIQFDGAPGSYELFIKSDRPRSVGIQLNPHG